MVLPLIPLVLIGTGAGTGIAGAVADISDWMFMRNGKMVLVPDLATDLGQKSADGLTWTFKIREGIKFHDGEAMTAEDVAFSVNLYKSNPDYVYLNSYTANFDTVEATDDTTVVITFAELYPAWPTLFTQDPDLVWGLIASLYIGNLMLLVLNLPLAGVWVRLLAIPRPLLYAGILVLAGLGTYGLTNSLVDLVVLYLLGALGFVMRRFDVPVAPAVIGVILGPIAEQHFRRALQIAQGDYATFVTRPISATILLLAALALVVPTILRLARQRPPTVDLATQSPTTAAAGERR